MAATEVAVIKPLKKPSESMRGTGKDTKKKLNNVTAAELLEKIGWRMKKSFEALPRRHRRFSLPSL